MRKLLPILVSAVLSASLLSGAPVLVEDGKPKASIVLGASPTAAAQLGAFELQHVIRLMTGAELPIITEPAKITGVPLFVGASEGSAARGLKAESYVREQYEVRTFPDAVVMIGNDDPDRHRVFYTSARTFPKMEYSFHSTLYAVYDFLENACGVRFYMPGDLGICFESRKTLIPEELNIRREPSVRGVRRCTMGMPWRIRPASTERDRALLFFRWRMNVLYGQSSHNTYGLFYRYWKKSPANPAAAEVFIREDRDLFAKGYEGKNRHLDHPVFPGDRDLPPNLCYSNEKLYEILADQAIRTAGGERIPWTEGAPKLPNMPYTYPMLGEDNNSYCMCPECRKLIPEGVKGSRQWTWLYFGFINRLCREVAKKDPSISIAAGVYQCPMQDVPLEPNMSLQLMFGINTWYLEGIRRRHMEIYDYWRKKAGDRPVTLWLYMLSPYWDMLQNEEPKKFFPGFYPRAVIPIARMFVKDGIQGWFSETFIDYTYLETWLVLMICYNRDFPAEKELELFYRNFFGAAAGPMREYWEEIENAFWNPMNYPESFRTSPTGPFHPADRSGILNIWTHSDDVNWGLGTEERIQKLDMLFRSARSAARTQTENARLDFVENTIHRQMVQGRKEYGERVQLRSNPLPEQTIPQSREANGNPGKAVFPASGGFPLRCEADGTQRSGPVPEIRCCYDEKFLYFEMRDSPVADGGELEICAGPKAAYPLHQFILTPKGTFQSLLLTEGRSRKFKADEKYISSFRNGKWTFRLALPLNRVCPGGRLEPGRKFRIQAVLRSGDGRVSSWSFLAGGASPQDVLYRMGVAELGPFTPPMMIRDDEEPLFDDQP